MWLRRGILASGAAVAMGGAGLWAWPRRTGSADLAEVRARVLPRLKAKVAGQGLVLGAPVFLRIFKESSELEVWLRPGARFELFRTYPICTWTGDLGPKLKEGDGQSPEGFYAVGPAAMYPSSAYHLSFNLGFPNAYDRALGRTGSYLMVHGRCASVGCYAMTDPGIEEIYLIAEAALAAGQQAFAVHIFPFRMTDAAMTRNAASPWAGFWANLRQGHDLFETSRLPPAVAVAGGRYVFSAAG